MYVWTKQLTKKVMDEPAGYSKEAIAEIAKKYENVAKNMNLERTNQISDQTVIYVLNESFSDPTKLSRLSISEDPIPEIRKILLLKKTELEDPSSPKGIELIKYWQDQKNLKVKYKMKDQKDNVSFIKTNPEVKEFIDNWINSKNRK